MMRSAMLAGALALWASGPVLAQEMNLAPPSAVTSDPPIDRAHPAAMQVVHIPAHGLQINGVLYTAAGPGLHPTVVLLHGFPGNEQNLDLAQAIRRDGWNVLTLHYRGSWGSPGVFSFTHVFEDAQSALNFVRDPGVAGRYAIDARRIVVVGHSMGGMAAAILGANNPGLAGVAMISAADFARIAAIGGPKDTKGLVAFMADNMESLAGVTPTQLASEAIANGPHWDFIDYAPTLGRSPLLLVTSDDGLAGASEALAKAVRARKEGPVTEAHLATDHSYSDRRIALQSVVVNWLESLHSERSVK